MSARCAKCGEELLGAVNRCWKCGQTFALRPEMDGRPPVRSPLPPTDPSQPLDAVVLDDAAATAASPPATVPSTAAHPSAVAAYGTKQRAISTADRIDAQRKSQMAMGGTVGSFVLALFALAVALFRFEAALIALLGLVMGIWGLYSPRRNVALVAMLLCCLAIGLGSYTGVRQLYIHILQSRPVHIDNDSPSPP
jgi:hypothetical protein